MTITLGREALHDHRRMRRGKQDQEETKAEKGMTPKSMHEGILKIDSKTAIPELKVVEEGPQDTPHILDSQIHDFEAATEIQTASTSKGASNITHGEIKRIIPKLLGISNEAQKPHAEFWMGAHPDLPSTLLDVDNSLAIPFDQAMGSAPEPLLGEQVMQRFGATLPFLFKVLFGGPALVHTSAPNQGAGRARLCEGAKLHASHGCL